MSVEDKLIDVVGTITLPKDPAAEYLSKFQQMATGTTEGPEFYVEERSRLEGFLARLSDAEFLFTDVPSDTLDQLDHVLTKAFPEIVQSFRFDRRKKNIAKEVNACRAELDKAFGQVFDTDYSPYDLVIFEHQGNVMAGKYLGHAKHDHVVRLIIDMPQRIQLSLEKKDILCRAEVTGDPPIDRKLVMVYNQGRPEFCGTATVYAERPGFERVAEEIAFTLDLPGLLATKQYSHEMLADIQATLLKAAVRNGKNMPHDGPYR